MQDTEKKSWGGKRREGKTKETIAVTIDIINLDWVSKFGKGKNRSDKINTILTLYRQRIEQLIAEADELNEQF